MSNLKDYSAANKKAQIAGVMDVAVVWQHCAGYPTFKGDGSACLGTSQYTALGGINYDRNLIKNNSLEGVVEEVFIIQTFHSGTSGDYAGKYSLDELEQNSKSFIETNGLDGFGFYTWDEGWYTGNLKKYTDLQPAIRWVYDNVLYNTNQTAPTLALSPTSATQPTSTPRPIPSATPFIPTSTPVFMVPTSTPTPFPTVRPTSTPVPTLTPTKAPTLVPSSTNVPTATAVPTQKPTSTLMPTIAVGQPISVTFISATLKTNSYPWYYFNRRNRLTVKMQSNSSTASIKVDLFGSLSYSSTTGYYSKDFATSKKLPLTITISVNGTPVGTYPVSSQ
jgi:hypothetical protein